MSGRTSPRYTNEDHSDDDAICVYGNAERLERILSDINQTASRIASGIQPTAQSEGVAEKGVDGVDAILCHSVASANHALGTLCAIERMMFGDMFTPPSADDSGSGCVGNVMAGTNRR